MYLVLFEIKRNEEIEMQRSESRLTVSDYMLCSNGRRAVMCRYKWCIEHLQRANLKYGGDRERWFKENVQVCCINTSNRCSFHSKI